ncbi:LytR/AlgR family response regulator transcription factor [Portibacter lacus]|uniref:DNA-binding response regulator n=1 Tax=Portibacter lacus TaxID=1099794 RepID=A0AA37ST37_9BACT|nr:LytTR family DNA-binding domain-containing protein [Portibacter lacus]GLR18186.1 DNA-binding response regulator [Portibacter lacus]
MKTIRSIIIDDEEHAQRSLTKLLSWVAEEVEIIDTCSSATEGLLAILEHQPELVFLDIEMPRMTGFDMLNKIKDRKFQVIFVTAYDEYAIKAFDANAIDYVLKPIDEERLTEAIEKVKKMLNYDSKQEKLEELVAKLSNSGYSFNKVALPTAEGLEFIEAEHILRLESSGNYTEVYTADGGKLLISKTMKEIAAKLPEELFIRPHNSHIINLQFIKKYIRGNGGQIILEDNSNIPVSRSNKDMIKDLSR